MLARIYTISFKKKKIHLGHKTNLFVSKNFQTTCSFLSFLAFTRTQKKTS